MERGPRSKYVIGNWKMHTTASEARRLSHAVVDGLGREGEDGASHHVKIAICPPFTHLAALGEILRGSRVMLGAQNLYPESAGAFTGEISPVMLRDLGCRFVIIGHSERRHLLGESDEFLNRKVKAALASGLKVIFCVGETQEQREAGRSDAVLSRQLLQGLTGLVSGQVHGQLENLIVAYEPIWAIGTGLEAPAGEVQEAHALIRHHFGRMFDETAAAALCIQYGGSVNASNAAGILALSGVDGVLIGGASLEASQFLAIVAAAIGKPQDAGLAA